jgi:hypothetical protein
MVGTRAIPLRVSMTADNPVPPRGVDASLFKAAPPDVQALEKRARKELRAKARKMFIKTYDSKRPT